MFWVFLVTQPPFQEAMANLPLVLLKVTLLFSQCTDGGATGCHYPICVATRDGL